MARFSSLRTKIFVADDENLLCAGNTYKRLLSLTTIFNIKYAGNSVSSLTTEDKIYVASDKNRAECARLKFRLHGVEFKTTPVDRKYMEKWCRPKLQQVGLCCRKYV